MVVTLLWYAATYCFRFYVANIGAYNVMYGTVAAVIALGVCVAGSVGLVAGRLLQASVSRRREHLADASAVQFTRNPGGLAGALKTVSGKSSGLAACAPVFTISWKKRRV